MIKIEAPQSYYKYLRPLCALAYAILVIALLAIAAYFLFSVVEEYRGRNAALERLAQVDLRLHRTSNQSTAEPLPPGPLVLEGPTESVATATLQHRVSTAVESADGIVLSSEVQPHHPDTRDELLRVAISCELPEHRLQQLLYDLESGMPFLFVDEIAVRSTPGVNASNRLQVRLIVAGLWLGGQ